MDKPRITGNRIVIPSNTEHLADVDMFIEGILRGYGNFVIINHGDRYYSTYGGLGKMSVDTNEYVLAGTRKGIP